MRAQDLRIGNWVNEYGVPIQITPQHILGLHQIEVAGKICIDLEPIPLTEEWLIRLGFEKRIINNTFPEYFIECTPKNYKMKYFLFFRFGLYHTTPKGVCDEQGWRPELSGSVHCFHLQHVHQLMNLFYALTGEELTLTDQG